MRYIVERNFVLVVGGIWWPYGAVCSMRYDLSSYDLENIGKFTRENVQRWLDTHAGDFSSIKDFYATAGDLEIPWASEEGEVAYLDTLPDDV